MPVLDCRIPREEWVREVGERNGVSVSPAEHAAEKSAADAGPWEPAVQKIVAFQHLGDDWDGFGALAPSRELLESAIGLAHLFYEKGVDPPHCVVPGLDGSVNLEWQDPDGTIAEVEIDRPLHAEVMVIEPGQPARHWTLPTE
ncbi:MAG TPA: hypothetical protein VG013_28235 [Gemmataceae bacterium]|jgi:hypothetical protein|nr:hypothetical protein [Gemmataceae bacterium]